uniref:Uncharacterized protein n=1 Tax=Rhizophora mucronata TaxID=61149 RepID=A0A2P2R438_RHIMU
MLSYFPCTSSMFSKEYVQSFLSVCNFRLLD